MIKKFVLVLCSLLVIPASIRASSSELSDRDVEVKVEALLTTMQKRLNLMDGVAKFKWNIAKPIEDKAQEQEILDNVYVEATAQNVDSVAMKKLFESQIQAAKLIQISCFDEWVKEDIDSHKDAPDLKQDIRPEITKLNQELFAQAKELQPYLKDPKVQALVKLKASEILRGDKIDDSVRSVAIESITSMQ